jgi:DNA topoisomerase IB
MGPVRRDPSQSFEAMGRQDVFCRIWVEVFAVWSGTTLTLDAARLDLSREERER